MAKADEFQKPLRDEASLRMSTTWILILLALGFFLICTFWLNMTVHTEQQFSFLAQSFLHSKLGFLERPGNNWADASPHGGQCYWPLGPFPAVLLMPFTFVASGIGVFFYQGYVQPFLVCLLLAIIFRIARRVGYGREDGLYIAFGFTFATAVLGVGVWPWSWQFAQVVTCLLLFAAISEMAGKQRPWIVGLLFALALATRATAALGVVWCVGEILLATNTWRKKAFSLAAIGFPCMVVLVLLLCYNRARFGDAFEQGYREQLVASWAENTRAQGILNLHHLPSNLYYLLLASPDPIQRDKTSIVLAFPYVSANPWGMSLFLTSPCFLYLFRLRYGDVTSRLLLLTVLVIAAPLLLYFASGFRQFGYRYSLDFLPFLYYLLLRNYRSQRGGLTSGFKVILIMTAFWNLYLFAGHFIWHAKPMPE